MKKDLRNIARVYARKASQLLCDMWDNCGKTFDYGSIEIEKNNLKEAYDALGKALDALGVPRMKPEDCKHREEVREQLNRSADRCGACGMLYGMHAGTKGRFYRKWMPPEQAPAAASAANIVSALLENERERSRGERAR